MQQICQQFNEERENYNVQKEANLRENQQLKNIIKDKNNKET
jgi:hypothetical protein